MGKPACTPDLSDTFPLHILEQNDKMLVAAYVCTAHLYCRLHESRYTASNDRCQTERKDRKYSKIYPHLQKYLLWQLGVWKKKGMYKGELHGNGHNMKQLGVAAAHTLGNAVTHPSQKHQLVIATRPTSHAV